MKHIIKNPEPTELSNWKTSYRTQNGNKLQDLYEQDNMTGGKLWEILRSRKNENTVYSKEELRASLINEQGYICCYCNREIDQDSAVIEHFMPKGMPEYFHLVYDYENLLASCDGFQSDPKPREVCCDAKRFQNETLPLNPTNPTIETHFAYTIDGQIIGLSDIGKDMIKKLSLDMPILEKRRETYIKDAIYENPFNKRFISKEEAKRRLVELHILKNQKFTPFCAAIIDVLRREILNEINL